jgi:hypothetical protein
VVPPKTFIPIAEESGFHLSEPLTGAQFEKLPSVNLAVRAMLDRVDDAKVVPLFA